MKLQRAPIPARFDGADIVAAIDGELMGFEICARGTRGYSVAVKLSPSEARQFAERVLDVMATRKATRPID